MTSDVRSQDTISVVTAVAANVKGRDLAWQFVKDNLGPSSTGGTAAAVSG